MKSNGKDSGVPSLSEQSHPSFGGSYKDRHNALERSVASHEVEGSFWNTMTRDKVFSVVTFCFANFCVGAYYSLPGPFYPQEASSKGLSVLQIGVVLAGFELAIIVSTPFFGTYLTQLGPRFTYIAGLVTSGSCAVLLGFLDMVSGTTTFFALSVSIRVVEGLGTSAFIIASFAIIAHTFPDKAAAMIGTLEMFTGLGLMVGPALGGVLYQYGGFGTPFWTTGGMLLAVAVASVFMLPQKQFDEDSSGSMLWLLRLPLVTITACFVLGGALCIGFLDVALALHLQELYDMPPIIIGLIFLIGPGAYAVSAPVYGWLADKLPRHSKYIILIGYMINAFGFTFLGPAPFLHLPDNILWLLLVSLLCFGVGVGTMVMGFNVMSQEAAKNGFEESLKTFGLIAGIYNASFSVGAFIGPILGGYLVDAIGFQWAAFSMGSFSVFMCLVLICYMVIHEMQTPKTGTLSRSHSHVTSLSTNEKTPLLLST